MLRRTREFGIRLAIGAQTTSILGAVIREAVVMIAIGVVFGLIASWMLGQVVSRLLFGLTPTDPSSIVIALILVATPAMIAAWLPARRASRISALVALRYE